MFHWIKFFKYKNVFDFELLSVWSREIIQLSIQRRVNIIRKQWIIELHLIEIFGDKLFVDRELLM